MSLKENLTRRQFLAHTGILAVGTLLGLNVDQTSQTQDLEVKDTDLKLALPDLNLEDLQRTILSLNEYLNGQSFYVVEDRSKKNMEQISQEWISWMKPAFAAEGFVSAEEFNETKDLHINLTSSYAYWGNVSVDGEKPCTTIDVFFPENLRVEEAEEIKGITTFTLERNVSTILENGDTWIPLVLGHELGHVSQQEYCLIFNNNPVVLREYILNLEASAQILALECLAHSSNEFEHPHLSQLETKNVVLFGLSEILNYTYIYQSLKQGINSETVNNAFENIDNHNHRDYWREISQYLFTSLYRDQGLEDSPELRYLVYPGSLIAKSYFDREQVITGLWLPNNQIEVSSIHSLLDTVIQ